MNRKIELLPNILTMGNLSCGFMAIIYISGFKIQTGIWLIFLGAFLDALDGKLARLLKTSSQFGIQIDSLADVVTFGIAPSFLLYSVYFDRFGFFGIILSCFPVLAGAFRLARYNINAGTTTKKDFSGLPIPVFAAAIGSYILFSYELWDRIRYENMLFFMTLLLSTLMVSSIRYATFPGYSLKINGRLNHRLILFLCGGLLIALSAKKFFFPVIWSYILFGIGRSMFNYIFRREDIDNMEEIVDPSLEN